MIRGEHERELTHSSLAAPQYQNIPSRKLLPLLILRRMEALTLNILNSRNSRHIRFNMESRTNRQMRAVERFRPTTIVVVHSMLPLLVGQFRERLYSIDAAAQFHERGEVEASDVCLEILHILRQRDVIWS